MFQQLIQVSQQDDTTHYQLQLGDAVYQITIDSVSQNERKRWRGKISINNRLNTQHLILPRLYNRHINALAACVNSLVKQGFSAIYSLYTHAN